MTALVVYAVVMAVKPSRTVTVGNPRFWVKYVNGKWQVTTPVGGVKVAEFDELPEAYAFAANATDKLREMLLQSA